MIGTLNGPQIERLLHSEMIGRIGCHAQGRTYVVPVTYVYEDGVIYGHTREGQKVQMMRENPEVCFEVDHLDGLSNWQSVICQGHFEELAGEDAAHAMQRLLDRLMPVVVNESSHPHGSLAAGSTSGHGAPGTGAVRYGIRVAEMTGRYEKT
ncbi:hypothetical protein FNU79_09730 [Deinococcus detaillensis]|uniref:Pyridoxamine 5'-phosphate oxidase family protein n=1 Tax=Deinococcus detaillensis TaxID=2592048 RepID=A0A553UZ24_9DEIO|nr:pyridoxamine 5'-phosphate oxidase family protein [Deinococcus detaillensis]TSA85467.1 hypothetical protein FNU79_09730 [Deinococcus detaillensis]